MKKFLRFFAVMTMVSGLVALFPSTTMAQISSPRVVSGKVLVKFAPEMEPQLSKMKVGRKHGYIQTGLPTFDALAYRHQTTALKRVFPDNPKKAEAHKRHGLHLWYELTVPLNKDVESIAREFKGVQGIAHAEPIHAKAMITPGKPKLVTETPTGKITEPVNDPFFYLQWHYENDGVTNGGIPEGDINLLEAWKVQTGNPNVIVSVHDLGIDVKHKDLAANMWVNTAEKNGRPGVDDDFNGYVDDVNGYDFSDDQGNVPPGDHGTHVGGTIAAVNNNGIGVSGIAGGDGTNPGVKLMTAKILNGSYDNIAASYVYAADNGAVISQNSWGYTNPGSVDLAVLEAIDYFIEEAGNFPNSPMKGGIVIFASGNSASNLDYYPARYDRVLSVASLARNNQRAYYSNYGPWVDIAAPGGDQGYLLEDGVLSTLPNNQYGFFQGTSMACPHVSGIAALIVSQYGGKNYTAQDLWTALVTGTHDINQYNPDYQDQLGIGYIDAALALKKNNRIAPAKVSDLSVAEVGMDFLNLQWTSVTDEDDDVATRYEVIFGKDSLEVAAHKAVKSLWINQSIPVGESVNASIQDLYANTKYFVAVHAYDRWGNKSALSTIKSGATTEGPHVSLDKSSLDFTIDVNGGTVATDQFNIINTTGGDLKWKAEVRQSSYALDWNSVRYPTAPATASKPSLGRHPSRGTFNRKLEKSTLGYNDGYEERAIRYVQSEYYYGFMIGEEDTSVPNAAATRFKVSYEDGFNLTNINMLLNNNPEDGDPPFVIEIYKGEELDKKNLVYVAEYQGYTKYDEVYNIQLNHQIFFEYGSTFWVVAHMPPGHLYPLGINEETQPEYSENCFMSFDVGKSWSRLEDLIPYNYYAWVCVPLSRTPGIDRYLTLEPAQGIVNGSGQQEISAVADATKLINGTYYADVVVLNNDYENQLASIPATVTVTGQKPALASEAIVNFGSVFTGLTKELLIDIENKGYGNFIVNSITSSHADFTIVDPPNSISALGSTSLKVKFKPSATALRNASIALQDQYGMVHKINLTGTGIAPSKITVTPASATYTMAMGQTNSGKFKIKNTGSYPLQFFAPKYSSGEGIDYVDNGFNKFGYSYRTTTDGSGLTYSWEDISTTGTEMGAFFKDVISNNFYPVNLGFEFPIFNRTTNKLMITRYGMLTIDDQVNVVGNGIQIGSEYMPYGFISALNQEISTEGEGKVYYQAKPGRFIVQYDKVQSAYNENQYYTFQIIVYDNGNVKINYKDLSTLDQWLLDYIEVAIEDPDKTSGYLISNYQNVLNASSNFSLEIVSPGANIITGLSTPQGTLGVGEEVEISYDLSTETLTEGTFWQNLVLVSNDPATPAKMFKVNVTVNSGGVAEVEATTNEIDLGEIFAGETVDAVIQVHNKGTRSAQLTGITSDHGYFTITHDALPITLKPKSSTYVQVKYTGATPTVKEDVIHIASNAGPVQNVSVKVVVLNPPAIALTYDPINDVLEAGESAMHTIDIKNTGTAELQVVPSGPSWALVVPAVAPSAGAQYAKNTYYWKKSTQEGGPTYVWEEIMEKSTKLDFSFDPFTIEEKEVELPFTFNFYGKDYSKVYVSPKGFLTFTPGQEVNFFPQSTIPMTEAPNNLIAPFWGPGAFYSLDNDIWGVYARATEDVLIVEFVYAYNVFGMGDPWNYQVMIYKNGNIKFQYQFPFAGFTSTNFGLVGVENEDGTDGVRIAAYQNFVEDKLAVMLTPANRLDIASGETITVNLKVDASDLFAGTYSDNLLLQTNVPGSTNLQVPLHLTVNGSPQVSVSNSLDFGDIVGEDVNGLLKTFSKEFSISNTGKATLDVSQLQLMNGESGFSLWTEYSDWFGTYWDLVPADFTFSLTPKTSMKFKIEVSPAVGENLLKDSLIVASNSPESSIKVPVRAAVVLPAVMTVDKTSVTFMAPDHTFTGDDSFEIGNEEGQSVLNYSLTVKYQRTGATASFAPSGVAKSGDLPTLSSATNNRLTPSILGEEGYNRTLEYSGAEEPEGTIGFGIGSMFVSGTKYVTPGDGFTLSHIQTFYASGNLAKSTITLGVYIGENVTQAKLMYAKAFDLDEAVGKDFEGDILLTLESPVHFYPGETFWIVLWHPFGADHPQGYDLIDETKKGTFMYYFPDFGIWQDISDDPSFRKAAWSVRALEKDYVNGNWLTIGSTEGQIPAGETATINLSAKAAGITDADTYAEVTVHSNSIGQATEKIIVNLHLNQAPQFGDVPENQWTDEMEAMTFTIPVQDAEGDEISINIPDAPDGMTWEKVDGGVKIAYTPDYLSAGIKNINVHAKDAGNREAILPVNVAVYNVNRSPVLVSNAIRNYNYGEGVEEVEVSEFISDPDTDDVLQVSVLSSDNDVVEVMASADRIRIKPRKPGEAVMTVQVTDPFGATLSTPIDVMVHMVTAIETPYFGGVKVYPNPAKEALQIAFDEVSLMAKEARIMDIAGNVLKQISLSTPDSSIDVSALAPGMYILRLSREDNHQVMKIIKN